MVHDRLTIINEAATDVSDSQSFFRAFCVVCVCVSSFYFRQPNAKNLSKFVTAIEFRSSVSITLLFDDEHLRPSGNDHV